MPIKFVERAVIALFSVIALVLAAVAIFVNVNNWIKMSGWEGLKPADWAAWAQAAGSFAAIAGALAIMQVQHSRQQRADASRKKEVDQGLLTSLIFFGQETHSYFAIVGLQGQPDFFEPAYAQFCSERLAAMELQMNAVPIWSMTPNGIKHLSSLKLSCKTGRTAMDQYIAQHASTSAITVNPYGMQAKREALDHLRSMALASMHEQERIVLGTVEAIKAEYHRVTGAPYRG